MLLLMVQYPRYDHGCDDQGDRDANRCAECETVEWAGRPSYDRRHDRRSSPIWKKGRRSKVAGGVSGGWGPDHSAATTTLSVLLGNEAMIDPNQVGGDPRQRTASRHSPKAPPRFSEIVQSGTLIAHRYILVHVREGDPEQHAISTCDRRGLGRAREPLSCIGKGWSGQCDERQGGKQSKLPHGVLLLCSTISLAETERL
jgi:hypothetical protein